MSDPVTIGISVAAIAISVASMVLTLLAANRHDLNLVEQRARRRP